MALVEQTYINRLPISRPKQLPLYEQITIELGEYVKEGGLKLPEGRAITAGQEDIMKVATIEKGNLVVDFLKRDEINSPTANLRTKPNRWGVHKRYRYLPSI